MAQRPILQTTLLDPPTQQKTLGAVLARAERGAGGSYAAAMARIRLFASAREAAGVGHDEIDGATVAEVVAAAGERYGAAFVAVLANCRIWVNGDEAEPGMAVGPHDELAILPPVSGG